MAGAKVVYNHFPQLARAMHLSTAQIVGQAAENIRDKAQGTVDANSRRTGELHDSVFVDQEGSFAIVGTNDFKAVWLEYGTGEPAPTRAEPFLTPAAETERGRFESAMRSIEPRLRVNAAGSVGLSANPNVSYSAREAAPQGAVRRRRNR